MNGKLKQRQHDATFEMKTLDARNKQFTSNHKLEVNEVMRAQAAQATKNLVDISSSWRDENPNIWVGSGGDINSGSDIEEDLFSRCTVRRLKQQKRNQQQKKEKKRRQQPRISIRTE